jgi:hypothetical protein
MSERPQFHPFVDIFPLMEGGDFCNLVEDIRTNGLREPVWVNSANEIIDEGTVGTLVRRLASNAALVPGRRKSTARCYRSSFP